MAVKNLILKLGLKGVRGTQSGLGAIDSGVKGITKSILKAGATFFAAKGIIEGVKTTIAVSSQLQAVKSGFDNLSQGIGGSEDTLRKLQDATDGTIDNIELMTQANNAMLLGIFENNDQMSEMFDVAQRLGSALGKDTAFGVESLVTGMGRQSKLMLDNLGIMVDTNEANERFAKSIGKSTKELTDQEKKQAFNNETMRQAKLLVDGLGEEQLTTSQRIDILRSSATNLAGTLGTALTPAFNSALDVLSSFSRDVSSAVNFLATIDFSATAENIKNNLTALLTAVREQLRINFDAVPELFQFALGKIIPIARNIFTNLVEGIKNIASFLFEPVVIFAQVVSAKVQNIFIGMFNVIKEQFNVFADSFLGEKLGIEKLEMSDFIDVDAISSQLAETDIAQFFGGENQVQTLSDFTERTKAIWGDYFKTVAVLSKESGEVVTKSLDATGKSAEKTGDKVEESAIKQAIATGQSSDSILGAVRKVIQARFASMMADILAKEIGGKGLLGLVTGAALAASATKLFDSLVPKFAEGGIVQGSGNQDTVPAMLTPGEVILNQAQQENLASNMGVTVNIQGGVVDESYVNNELIPALNKATSLGATLNA